MPIMLHWIAQLPPLLIVLLAIGAVWIALRWGAAIFVAYAIWHLCTGNWTAAALAFGIACFLQALRTPTIIYDGFVRRRTLTAP